MKQRSFRRDLTGERFGRLIVTEWVGSSRWRCQCDCGGKALVLTANLTRGNTSSCGCVRNIASSKRATTHGLSNTPAYKSWASIKKRCLNPRDSQYRYYGGAGIEMHPEWAADPVAFCRYIGQPANPEMSVDRIDNTKGYVPGNVRWATSLEQARNRSLCVAVEFQGHKFGTISEFVDWLVPQTNVNRQSLRRELIRRLK